MDHVIVTHTVIQFRNLFIFVLKSKEKNI